MILINLLPAEYRQKRRTPVKILAAVAVSATINASLLAYWAWTAFGVAAEVSSELAVLEDTMTALEPQIAYHDALDKESKLFHSREQLLADVTGKRISWTEKLDQLIDIVHKGGDGEKYLVWFDNISVDTDVNERAKTYGTLDASGNSGSAKSAHIANFLDDVQASEMSRDFNPPRDPEGTVGIVDEDFDPPEVWAFPFEMTLKSPEDRRAAAGGAAAPSTGTEPVPAASKPEAAAAAGSGAQGDAKKDEQKKPEKAAAPAAGAGKAGEGKR